MDYWNGTTNKTISLAVVRVPAKVPITDPSYGGAVLVNPGGPGGSGVNLAIGLGEALQDYIGPDPYTDNSDHNRFARNFDIIAFDPRGVSHTLPHVSCFAHPMLARTWEVMMMEEGILTSSDAALGRLWSMKAAYGGVCSNVSEDSIHHYVSTASVARDMVELTEAHGRWREKESAKLESRARARAGRRSQTPALPAVAHLKYRPGEEKIQYWGFSYGSYLGTTFASMFPERVERLVVDGVVDAEDYAANLWFNNLFDTESVVDLFYHHCARAGPSACALAKDNFTAADVEQRVKSIVASVYHNPVPVIGADPAVISWSAVRGINFAVLYSPVLGFPAFANILARIEEHNAEAASSLMTEHAASVTSTDQQPNAEVYDDFAKFAIMCTDGDPQNTMTKDDFKDYMDALLSLSPNAGDIWSLLKLQCISYSLRAYHRHAGPWTGNTSRPILLVGNTADPVTPVRNAWKMAEGFTGKSPMIITCFRVSSS